MIFSRPCQKKEEVDFTVTECSMARHFRARTAANDIKKGP